MRAAVFDDELLMHLHFTKHPETIGGVNKAAFTLWHLTTTNVDPAALTAENIVSMIRPTEAIFDEQLDLVDGYSDLREDRASEILAQMVPPHAFWSSVVMLHPDRNKWTLELLATALRLANLVEMRFKHALACRRPAERSPQIQPIILTPGHGSLPSGHSTEAHIVARVLYDLVFHEDRADGGREAGPARATDAPGGPHRDQPDGGGRALPRRQCGGATARPDPRRVPCRAFPDRGAAARLRPGRSTATQFGAVDRLQFPRPVRYDHGYASRHRLCHQGCGLRRIPVRART